MDHVPIEVHGQEAVLVRVHRGLVERDVERDDARTERAQRAEEVGVRLVGQGVVPVLAHGVDVECDDGDLVADGGVSDLDRLVVNNRLEGGVERFAREE